MKVVLFGNRVFEEVIEIRGCHAEWEWDLIQWQMSLWKVGNLDTNTQGRECYVKTETQTHRGEGHWKTESKNK